MQGSPELVHIQNPVFFFLSNKEYKTIKKKKKKALKVYGGGLPC